jgi:hypothetical protein
MEASYAYVLAAAIGGLVGGLGHAIMSQNVAFTRKTTAGDYDFSGLRDLGVGLFSGFAWLLPNQSSWIGKTPNSPSDLILIALQTMLIGLAGSGWLTSQLDAGKLKGAVVKATGAVQNPAVAAKIAQAKNTGEIENLVDSLQPAGNSVAPSVSDNTTQPI